MYLIEKRNGAPFEIGNSVRVISGPHKGSISQIYEVCEEIHMVRIDLGIEAKEKFEDFVSFLDVMKISRAKIEEE